MRDTLFLIRKRLGGLIAGSLILMGCATTTVRTNFDQGFNFAAHRNYAWRPVNYLNGRPLSSTARLYSRIQAAVDHTLAGKGLSRVTPEQADLMVGFDVSTEEKIDVSDIGNHWQPGFWEPTYLWATLTLEFLQPGSQNRVWNGSIHEYVRLTLPLEERNRRLREDVEYLLNDYPPSPPERFAKKSSRAL